MLLVELRRGVDLNKHIGTKMLLATQVNFL